MTECRLTTEQLLSQAAYHRRNAANHKGPTHNMVKAEEQTLHYRACQETMAELYEELAERRQCEGDNWN
jgi:hypothetical protein